MRLTDDAISDESRAGARRPPRRIALTGCAKTLHRADDIEADIEGEYADEGTVESVSCPDDIEAEAGGTGECSLTANGVTVPVEISVTSEDGAYNFEIPPSEVSQAPGGRQPLSARLSPCRARLLC